MSTNKTKRSIHLDPARTIASFCPLKKLKLLARLTRTPGWQASTVLV